MGGGEEGVVLTYASVAAPGEPAVHSGEKIMRKRAKFN